MWLLRNGVNIRVDLEEDPCWNKQDIWKARNLWARFKTMGYSNRDCSTYASASVWKTKWNGMQYSQTIEKSLENMSLDIVAQIPIAP